MLPLPFEKENGMEELEVAQPKGLHKPEFCAGVLQVLPLIWCNAFQVVRFV